MKNNKISSLMILSLCAFMTACSGNSYTKVSGSPYEGLNGRTAKKVYQSLTTVGIGSLNYLQTSAQQNAQHFANFVDGLLTHNDFGTLELNLAESAEHNNDYTEFKFKVREDENLYWSTFEGKPYSYNGEVQYVKAKDFVSGAKLVCTYSVQSDTYYLLTDFIKGACEYYYYTYIVYEQAQGLLSNLKTDAAKINYIADMIKNNNPNVWAAQYDEDKGGTPLVASDLASIANGSRLGVSADDSTNTVTYTLLSSARYFPTLLTYSCYLPVCENFYNEKGASKFGVASADSILYCGPYILSQLDETNIVYKKNTAYDNRADLPTYAKARVETIRYNIVKTEIDNAYIRNQFENGNIDGFSLSPNDTEGWNKYVLGEDKSGSIEEPYSGLVNSRWLDTIGSCYGSNIVMSRTDNDISAVSYSTYGSSASVKNTERALRLQEVRQAILGAIDYREYYARYAEGEKDNIFSTQRLVHTYVPENFVMDDNGNEYTQEYYAKALADYEGITKEEAQAEIKTGQYETRHLDDQDDINALVDKAVQAITDYNNDADLVDAYGKITYPINIEYYSLWSDQETKTYDAKFINSMNKRLNNITDVGDDYSNCSIFKVVPTDKLDSSNYNQCSGSSNGYYAAYDFSVVQWGWGADYGDPLTYMNTYTIGGDWGSVFYYINEKNVPNIRRDSSNNLEVVNLLEEYTELVNEGKEENENLTNRYTYFAEAEVKLIKELGIYLPQVNYGQGWSLSISKSAGYEMPTSNYGLSNERLTGMWVLKEPLTRAERAEIRKEQEAAKAEWLANHDAYNIYGDED